MSLLIFFIVFFLLRGATPRDQRKSDVIKLLIGLYIASAILSSVMPALTGVAGLAFIGFIIYRLVRKSQQKTRDYQNQQQQTYNDTHGYQEPTAGYRQAQAGTGSYSYTSGTARTHSSILPHQANKRLKIVRNFNKKFNLALTDEQMDRIVNSSYMSETWKREVEAMTVKYNSVYEWFQGETRYLRAYLYAFNVQEVSSDITQQEQICMHAFEQVWSYADSMNHLSLEERIRKVNDTYFTKFDNNTFMIAYRFLEARGRKHKLDAMDPIQTGDDMEDLKKKYDHTAGQSGGQAMGH